MSGGRFDYAQYRIHDIVESIEEEIANNKNKEGYWLSEEDMNNPNWQRYSDETIKKFKEGIKYLKIAEIYAQRIDWLISGDDGEREFHKRLEKELKELK